MRPQRLSGAPQGRLVAELGIREASREELAPEGDFSCGPFSMFAVRSRL